MRANANYRTTQSCDELGARDTCFNDVAVRADPPQPRESLAPRLAAPRRRLWEDDFGPHCAVDPRGRVDARTGPACAAARTSRPASGAALRLRTRYLARAEALEYVRRLVSIYRAVPTLGRVRGASRGARPTRMPQRATADEIALAGR